MKTNLFACAALAALVSFSSCSKDKKNDAQPTFGTATIGGSSFNLNQKAVDASGGTFSISNFTESGGRIYGLSVDEDGARPTASGTVTGAEVGWLVINKADSSIVTVKSFYQASQTITRTVTAGKVKYTFTNLKETDSTDAVITGGAMLTGSVSE